MFDFFGVAGFAGGPLGESKGFTGNPNPGAFFDFVRRPEPDVLPLRKASGEGFLFRRGNGDQVPAQFFAACFSDVPGCLLFN
jgi:hypothetical protein